MRRRPPTAPATYGALAATHCMHIDLNLPRRSAIAAAPTDVRRRTNPPEEASCPAVTAPETPAGWYPDPTGGHQHRYWDGRTWTDQIADSGVASTEPATEKPETQETPEPSPPPNRLPLVLVLLAGAAASLFFGAYGRIHDPTGETTITLFFTSTINLKVWFTTVAIVFALVQVFTALRIYGK